MAKGNKGNLSADDLAEMAGDAPKRLTRDERAALTEKQKAETLGAAKSMSEPEGGTVAGKRLKQYIERIERLEEERRALGADVRDVFAEAKGSGFDVKTMRQVLRLRKMADQERRELNELLDLYMSAIGME